MRSSCPSADGYEDFTVASLPAGGLDSGSDDRWEIGGTPGANTYIEAAFTASQALASPLTPL